MDYQSTKQTLEHVFKRFENALTLNATTDAQKLLLKQRKKDISDCLDLVKRVKHYGGINNLLELAAKAAQKESLFEQTESEKV